MRMNLNELFALYVSAFHGRTSSKGDTRSLRAQALNQQEIAAMGRRSCQSQATGRRAEAKVRVVVVFVFRSLVNGKADLAHDSLLKVSLSSG